MILAVVFAVFAAFSNATASVLQRKAARREPQDQPMGLRMLWFLAHQPAWVGGISAIAAGFALQVAALATGPISLIQPILVIELSFTMLLSWLLLKAELHLREWTAIVGMTAGVALLLATLRPTGGNSRNVAGTTWVLGCVVTLGLILTLVVLAYRGHHARRAALLGISCGLFFGFIAVLVSGMTGEISAGIGAVFSAWQTYAVIVAGPTGFFLLQITLRAGRLVASQPGLTLSNPLVGIGWGVAVFGEQVQGGPWLAAELIGAALVAASTFLLTRSPMLQGSEGSREEAGVEDGQGGRGGQEEEDTGERSR